MKTDNNEYLEHLNKYYPEFDVDSINSIADIAIQMGINRKDAKLIDSEGFITFIHKVNDLKDDRKFRRMVEKIASEFNSILDEFKDADLDNEKIAEKLANKLDSKFNCFLQEFEDLTSEFCEEYPELFDWLVKPELILFESPEISSRNDSNLNSAIDRE
jgi:hypothetical protein